MCSSRLPRAIRSVEAPGNRLADGCGRRGDRRGRRRCGSAPIFPRNRKTRKTKSAAAVLNSIKSGASWKGWWSSWSNRRDRPRRHPAPAKFPRRKAAAPALGGNGLRRLVRYSYSIAGVTYETAQDVTGLEERLCLERIASGQPASVKYDPSNPSNSILVADDWSGLHLTSPCANANQEIGVPGFRFRCEVSLHQCGVSDDIRCGSTRVGVRILASVTAVLGAAALTLACHDCPGARHHPCCLHRSTSAARSRRHRGPRLRDCPSSRVHLPGNASGRSHSGRGQAEFPAAADGRVFQRRAFRRFRQKLVA